MLNMLIVFYNFEVNYNLSNKLKAKVATSLN